MEFQPKNSTTGRKAGNDMKKNSGIAKMGDSPAAWQKADKGLAFNGQDNGSSQRASMDSGCQNPQPGFADPDRIQMRQQAITKGYNGSNAGKRQPPVTAAGAGVTGKREWSPSAGMNFKGNPDKIQDRQLYNRVGNKD